MTTPLKITAGMVAAELRRLADALDKEPDAECVTPYIFFSCKYSRNPKDQFLTAAKAMPHPFAKKFTDDEIRLEYVAPGLEVIAYTHRTAVCTLIEPAKPAVYDCVPLLSAEEEAQLEGAA